MNKNTIVNIMATKKTAKKGAVKRAKKAVKNVQPIRPVSLARPAIDAVNESQTEIVIALVGAVGTELSRVEGALSTKLAAFGPRLIHVSKHVIAPTINPELAGCAGEYNRINRMMNAGDELRQKSGEHGILAMGVALAISKFRSNPGKINLKTAYIISSLKHPEEVKHLRQTYPHGFYLIGVHADRARRFAHLIDDKRMTKNEATVLMRRDQDEKLDWGQKVTETFHLADFFLRLEGDEDRMKQSLARIVDIVFGDPYKTPTFNEYAMFLAFSASLRSADLSRQVGAVIARGGEIIATGANDCPKPGGGLYWPTFDPRTQSYQDTPMGRDWTRKSDSNKAEQDKIINIIVKQARSIGLRSDEVKRINKIIDELSAGRSTKKNRDALLKIKSIIAEGHIDREQLRDCLNLSPIRDLTEFGRVVHAEMEALLSCARNRTSTVGATLYSTTFPCHNCAKHIIAAGISRVIFVEPYQKSKAQTFHGADAIKVGFGESGPDSEAPIDHVQFEHFVGVGPRRFFDLFSMKLTSGRELKRHNGMGKTVEWIRSGGVPRIQMKSKSYLDMEAQSAGVFERIAASLGPILSDI